MEHAAQTEWIAERAKCNVQRLWQELVPLLTANVRRRTDEAEHEAGPGSVRYVLDKNPDRVAPDRLHILRCQDTPRPETVGSCWFIAKSDCIRVIMDHPTGTGTISTRWDAEKSKCYILAVRPSDNQEQEFPYAKLWKALQFILEPFFFPAPGEQRI